MIPLNPEDAEDTMPVVLVEVPDWEGRPCWRLTCDPEDTGSGLHLEVRDWVALAHAILERDIQRIVADEAA